MESVTAASSRATGARSAGGLSLHACGGLQPVDPLAAASVHQRELRAHVRKPRPEVLLDHPALDALAEQRGEARPVADPLEQMPRVAHAIGGEIDGQRGLRRLLLPGDERGAQDRGRARVGEPGSVEEALAVGIGRRQAAPSLGRTAGSGGASTQA